MAARAKNKRPPEGENRQAEVFAVRAAVQPTTIDEKARTVELVWSTGARVRRFDWWREIPYDEVLSMDARHVKLDRLNQRAPVLDSHSAWRLSSVLGVVESARLEGGQGVAKVRFSEREDVGPIWDDIRAGIITQVSIGYTVRKWKRESPVKEGEVETRTAIDWSPYEISMVPIGADAGAQVRAGEFEDDDAARGAEEGTSMTEEEKKAAAEAEAKRKADEAQQRAIAEAAEAALVTERKRVADINALCDTHGVDSERRSKWLADGKVTVDAVRTAILDGIAERNKASQISPAVLVDNGRSASMVRDATNALLLRAGVKLEKDEAESGRRHFGAGSLIRMAERVLAAGGVNTSMLADNDIAKRALSTSDFATILNAVGQKLVRSAYDATPLVHRTVLRRTTANDFKNKNVIQVAGGQLLEKVPEGGKIPSTNISKEMASYKLETYGKIIPFTRQMIVNDDFGAIASASQQRGRAAAETERKAVWDFIQSNPNAQDGNVCFDDTVHVNIITASTGAGVTAAHLSTARRLLREQNSSDGVAINSELRYLVCGTKIETVWDQLLNGIYVPTAATTAVTARMRSVELLVEPLITAEDWFGFTDYNQVDHFEFAYLAGAEGPQFDQRYSFETEGLELKVTLDFGVGLVDWRGAVMMDNSAT
jgi:hypothetical protein